MIRALATLLAVAGATPFARAEAPAQAQKPAAPAAPTKRAPPALRAEGAPAADTVPLRTRDDIARLCGALLPAERLRGGGDAVERGQAEARHDAERDAALERRYEIAVPATSLAFSAYDAREKRLVISPRADLLAADGVARLFVSEERGLPVEVEAAAARRILDAQKAGRLALAITFDLPDEATCLKLDGAARWTVPVEPVSWTYGDGEAALARGGAGAERPLTTAAQGARPRVVVGEPLDGSAMARPAVQGRAASLEACYREALKRDPALDGVIVAAVGGERATIGADSVGDPALAECVTKALTSATPVRAMLPIRFELEAP